MAKLLTSSTATVMIEVRIDVLIGSYTFANSESVKTDTYVYRTQIVTRKLAAVVIKQA